MVMLDRGVLQFSARDRIARDYAEFVMRAVYRFAVFPIEIVERAIRIGITIRGIRCVCSPAIGRPHRHFQPGHTVILEIERIRQAQRLFMRRVVIDVERIRQIVARRLPDIIEELIAGDLLESDLHRMRAFTSHTPGYVQAT